MSLADFWNCSLWEFSSAVTGYNKAQGSDDVPDDAWTPEDYDELLRDRGYR